mgnify:CR=1 FL=1
MKFDMHCHTKEGSLDGKVEIEEYIRILKEKGYQGMLVSDHNSYNGYRYWRDHIKGKKYTDFVVLKGIEYDTNNAGHFLVILPEGVKPRILEMRGMPVELLTRVVHAYGGILGPAHPFGEKYLSLEVLRNISGTRRSCRSLISLRHTIPVKWKNGIRKQRKRPESTFWQSLAAVIPTKRTALERHIQNFVNRSIQNPI